MDEGLHFSIEFRNLLSVLLMYDPLESSSNIRRSSPQLPAGQQMICCARYNTPRKHGLRTHFPFDTDDMIPFWHMYTNMIVCVKWEVSRSRLHNSSSDNLFIDRWSLVARLNSVFFSITTPIFGCYVVRRVWHQNNICLEEIASHAQNMVLRIIGYSRLHSQHNRRRAGED